jgi:hypothetical protein
LELSANLKEETMSTRHFIEMFDRFFDMLNVRRLGQDVRTRKPDLAAFKSVDDPRLKVYLL